MSFVNTANYARVTTGMDIHLYLSIMSTDLWIKGRGRSVGTRIMTKWSLNQLIWIQERDNMWPMIPNLPVCIRFMFFKNLVCSKTFP